MEPNLVRRQPTDAQKVMLDRQIEPDVAEEARRRQAALGRSHGNDPSAAFAAKGKTADLVADKVGLGSGDTYERHKQVIEAVEREAPDAPLPPRSSDSSRSKIAG